MELVLLNFKIHFICVLVSENHLLTTMWQLFTGALLF